jgi:hypothetical protein
MRALASLLVLAVAAVPQETAPAASDDAARALWTSFLAASGSRADTPPITAFHVRADVVTREGVQTNQLRTEYRFLAPDSIRFLLASRRETGRSGPKQRDYWLKDADEVVELVGADHEQDRLQVDRMLAVARNFVGLSDPAKVRIERCELLASPPNDLGPDRLREARKLSWLAVESPDFVLTPETADRATTAGALVRVELGLLDSRIPRYVIVRQAKSGDPAGAGRSMLLELEGTLEPAGYRVPKSIKVHDLDPAASPPAFAKHPAQDIFIETIDLRPAFSPRDFQPKPR